MNRKQKQLIMGMLLCMLLLVMVMTTVDNCYAVAAKSGGLLKKADWDESRAPNKWQVMAGIGSWFVMFAVVKWL